MFGRRANRRRVEKKISKVKLPKMAIKWRARMRAFVVTPLVVGAALAGLNGARALLDQPVRKLVVEGTFQRVTPIQVEEAVATDLTRGFLSLDLEEVRDHVRGLDWVDEVSVGRAWPDTLIVRVTEHRAAARWGDNGLLNVRGELFTARSQHALPELPSLSGPPGSEHEVATRYLAVRGRLAEANLALESLSMDERGAWLVLLAGGQEIRLGRRDIDERLLRFFEVVAPALAAELPRVQYIDLRYSNGFAVGWREEGKAALAAAAGTRDRG
jgi:cell division protein FtsQ